MTNHSKPCGSIKTVWELRTYDVWGNDRDGYEVNNVFSAGTVELRIPQTRHNVGVEWHICRNPECPGNNPCGHEPKCAWGTHRRESHGVFGNPVYQYDPANKGMATTPSRFVCPECDATVELKSQEFISAYPTHRQIKRAFGVNCRIETSGDDLVVYVERERDGYPIGEMKCVSHESLSPVRKGGN